MKTTLSILKFKKLLQIRAHIGHQQKILNKTMNSLILSNHQEVSVLNNFAILWSWERCSHLFSKAFLRRQRFFVLSTNRYTPKTWLRSSLDWNFKLQDKRLPYYLGYLDSSWTGGMLTNWSKIWSFVLSVFKKIAANKHVSKKKFVLLKKVLGQSAKGAHPSFPDFILCLNVDKAVIREANLNKIITFGLTDSNSDITIPSVPLIGNDDSVMLIESMFRLIEQSYFLSSREEQELFYLLILKKLKKLLRQ